MNEISKEHIYDYQAYLVNEKKVGYSAFKIIVNSLRFFYNKVLGFDWMRLYRLAIFILPDISIIPFVNYTACPVCKVGKMRLLVTGENSS